MSNLNEFLSLRSQENRISFLKENSLELSTFQIENLVKLHFSNYEKSFLVGNIEANSTNEHLLINFIKNEHQDTAVQAFMKWVYDSPRMMWLDLVEFAKDPAIAQRLKFRFLDEARYSGGGEMLDAIDLASKYDDLSHATRTLLASRFYEWGKCSDNVSDMVIQTVFEIFSEDTHYPRDFIGTLQYICENLNEEFKQMSESSLIPYHWRKICQNILLSKQDSKTIGTENLAALLNPTLSRELLLENTFGISTATLESFVSGSPDEVYYRGCLGDRLTPERSSVLRQVKVEECELSRFFEKTGKMGSIDELAQYCRQQPWVLQAYYIRKLGDSEDADQARLKLLDYTRAEDELILVELIYALAKLKNTRATQELINLITRPNITQELQTQIYQELSCLDVTTLQGELRSAITDLHQDNRHIDNLKEQLRGLLEPTFVPKKIQSASGKDVDIFLNQTIPHFDAFSSEVKRALRTAAFVDKSITDENIDLSPIVDMQYKSLELFFREQFEKPCKELIQSGLLQTKLDVIGYARPVEHQMNAFEDYLQKQPVIKEIPYFSRFKLRKLLRAICQFRPGKRFTLDGLKAFGLFFLAFSRTQDRHGLEGLFPLHFKTDLELFEFCSSLHVLQDIRNRAAHEGFQPDSDIKAVWEQTAKIFSQAVHAREMKPNKATSKAS